MTLETASLTQAHGVSETRRVLDDMLASFEAFKQANDARLDEIEKRDSADVLLEEKVERINARVTQLNSDMQRPAIEAATGASDGGEIKAAFDDYIRRGNMAMELKNALAAGTTQNADPAAIFVPDYFEHRLTEAIGQSSALSRLAQTQRIEVGQDIEYIRQMATAGATWANETDERPPTDGPKLQRITIEMGELYANPTVTQRFFDAAAIDVEHWLLTAMAQAFDSLENEAFISGDGVEKPRGLFEGASEQTRTDKQQLLLLPTGRNAGFAVGKEYETLLGAIFNVAGQYRSQGSWMMNANVQAEVRKMKDANGHYLWMPSASVGQQPSLLGYHIYDEPHMLDIAKDAVIASFGDFSRAYMIIRPPQTRLIRDPYSSKPYLQFYATRSVGGAVIDPKAFASIQASA